MSSKSEFIAAAQVMARYGGVSHMWLRRKQQKEGFPSPVRFGGRLRFWKVSDLERWERSKLADLQTEETEQPPITSPDQSGDSTMSKCATALPPRKLGAGWRST